MKSKTSSQFHLLGKRALIIANGEIPRKQTVEHLLNSVQLVVCADGGANAALKYGIRPDAIVGDMDSIHTETRVKFQKAAFVEILDDDATDLEKAIRWTINHQFDHITVVGAMGKRLDHTCGNLGTLAKFYPDAVIVFVDDLGEVHYVGRELSFEAPLRTTISLIPLTRCEGVTTQGVRYALTDETLEIGVREGTSNVVASNPVKVVVQKGNLLLYKLLTRA
ncbi:MAG: thiamine diphosphokinase [bacterium]